MPQPAAKSPRVAVAGILQRGDGRVLLGRRGKEPGAGTWAFPGGSLEWGESLVKGAQREFYEETGIWAEPVSVAYLGELITEESHFVLVDYWMSAENWTASASSDLVEVAWVSAEVWMGYHLADGMHACLRDPGVRRLLGWPA